MGPALFPSKERQSSRSARLLAELFESRFQCVMNFEAFHANTKSLPVCERQLSTVLLAVLVHLFGHFKMVLQGRQVFPAQSFSLSLSPPLE